MIYLKFWILPVFTVLPLVNYWRTIAEHSSISNKDYDVRTVIYHPIVAWFISPYKINLHSEHHYRPSVKWYDLNKIYLKEKDKNRGHYTYGIKNLWRELVLQQK